LTIDRYNDNDVVALPLPGQWDDYVDKKVTFSHPDCVWRWRFISDWDRARALVDDDTTDIVYIYQPPNALAPIDHDVVAHLAADYRKWKLAGDVLGPELHDWAASLSRSYSSFPNIPIQQLEFAHRHVTTTFFMDDPFEKSCRLGVGSTFGLAYLGNLMCIYRKEKPHLMTDLTRFESDIVTKELIQGAHMAMEVVRENNAFGQRVLSPAGWEYQRLVGLEWLDSLARERLVIDQSSPTRHSFTVDQRMEIRMGTVGLELISPGIIPQDDVSLQVMMPFNPFVYSAAAIGILDNDTTSSVKERGTGADDEHRSNLFFAYKHAGNLTDMQAIRVVTKIRNNYARNMEMQYNLIRESWRPAYYNMLKYCFLISDYEWCVEHGTPNPRYGWTWTKED
jgi:hypothetical protein